MTFAAGDYVEHGGYRLGRIVRGPVRRYGTDDWWLVAPMNVTAGDGTYPDWAQTRQLTPADMASWLYCLKHNTYHRIYRPDMLRCEPCKHYDPRECPGTTSESGTTTAPSARPAGGR